MIVPPTSVRVLVATQPRGLPQGHGRAGGARAGKLRADPFSGVIYVFRAKRATA